MRTRVSISFLLIILIIALSACSKSTETYTKVSGTDPIKISDMVSVKDGRLPITTDDSINLASEFNKDDKSSNQKAEEDLIVYRKADEKSSKLGTIKKGSNYTVYAKLGNNWFKISFNGRIAYVKPPIKETVTSTTPAIDTTTTEQIDEEIPAISYEDYRDDVYDNDNTTSTEPISAIQPNEIAEKPTEPSTDSVTQPTDSTTEPTELITEPANPDPVTEPSGQDPVTEFTDPSKEPTDENP